MLAKKEDISNQFNFRNVDLALISETWQGNLDVEELEQMNSISWYAKPRRGARGGGVAVVASNCTFKSKTYKVKVPDELEIVWAILTPHVDPSLKILAGCFYSSSTAEYQPPTDLLQKHAFEVITDFTTKFKHSKAILGGTSTLTALKISFAKSPSNHTSTNLQEGIAILT